MSNLGKTLLYTLLILLSVALIAGGVALIVHFLGITDPPDDTSGPAETDSVPTPPSGTETDETDGTSLPDTETDAPDDTDPSETDGVLVIEYDEPVIMYALHNVNARMKDTTESDIMGMVYMGDAITVTGETSNKWYRVNYRGYTAYIRSDLLTPDSSIASVNIEEYKTPVTMYAVSNVNVRASHSTNSEKYETIALGTEVKVTGHTENGWYRIEYGETFAYISDDYLSEEKPVETDATAE